MRAILAEIEGDSAIGGSVVYFDGEGDGAGDGGAGGEGGEDGEGGEGGEIAPPSPQQAVIPGTGANRATWRPIGERIDIDLSSLYNEESGAFPPAGDPIVVPIHAFH